jgi:transcriptional regulator with XRE-family HTH domain
MKEQRHAQKLSQAKLAEKADTSSHYIGMIEMEKKFPTPEMLAKIASALKIDTPELFSTRSYPSETADSIKKFQELVMSDIEKVISYRLKELEPEQQ